jgi:hypothetical protein
MPDNVEEMLSELAHAVGEGVRSPAGSAVRRRAARRTMRHRVTASVLAVGVVGAIGGATTLISLNGTGHTTSVVSTTGTASGSTAPTEPPPSSTASPNPSASTSAESPSSNASSGPPASTPTTSQPTTGGAVGNGASTENIPLSELVGIWKPSDGEGRALVVLPDGEIGLGEAGGYGNPMCAGTLGAESGGSFPVVTIACADGGTSGLSLSLHDPAELVLHSPTGNVTWIRDVLAPTIDGGSASALPSWLVGTWAPQQNASYETFVISSSGSMTWSLESQTGGETTGTATVTSIGGGEYVARTTEAGGLTMFWLFKGLSAGGLEVIGGYGPNAYSHPAQSVQSTP